MVPPRETGLFGVPADYPSESEGFMAQNNVYVDQIPFNFCPERLGKPPKHCDLCGGCSYHHGICNDLLLSGRQTWDYFQSGSLCNGYYCQCSHEDRDHNPRVASTTVIDGQSGTVIFGPMTLEQYSNLRYKTTVTLTEVATRTESDGGSGLETALAAIFAGGIA
jgi:hypothetical protein